MGNENGNAQDGKTWEKVAKWSFSVVLLIFMAFSFFLFMRGKDLGTFGDSFGIVTCLFSGLSSAGMIVAIFMQHDELKLQRTELEENRKVLKQQQLEFEKTANAQQNSVQLSALSTLMESYEKRILLNDGILKFNGNNNPLQREQAWLMDSRSFMIGEIDKILRESGMALPVHPLNKIKHE